MLQRVQNAGQLQAGGLGDIVGGRVSEPVMLTELRIQQGIAEQIVAIGDRRERRADGQYYSGQPA
jgi:hypothetical protein